MLSFYYSYLCALSLGLFWSLWVLFMEINKILRNGLLYFKSPQITKYPSEVFDEKYGQSCFKEITTTKGHGESTVLKLHYMLSGNGNRDTMLFLHGFPEFWYSWRYQIVEFKKTYRVIALDMRGYGLSDKPPNVADYRTIHVINDIKALLDSLNIRSVTLVAHDWGGLIGWAFDNAYPEMVDKYISLNIPHPLAFKKVIKRSTKQFLKSWYIYLFQLPFLPEWTLSRFDFEAINTTFNSKYMGMQKTKLSQVEMAAFKSNMTQKGAISGGINYYRAVMRFPSSASKNNTTWEDVNRYMLIFGECDGAIETETATETQTMIPTLTLKLLPGLSHWVQQDDPDIVNRLIQDFVNGNCIN